MRKKEEDHHHHNHLSGIVRVRRSHDRFLIANGEMECVFKLTEYFHEEFMDMTMILLRVMSSAISWIHVFVLSSSSVYSSNPKKHNEGLQIADHRLHGHVSLFICIWYEYGTNNNKTILSDFYFYLISKNKLLKLTFYSRITNSSLCWNLYRKKESSTFSRCL